MILPAITPKIAAGAAPADESRGFQGIWFTLGQPSKYGDKYSGGLGTYTANHNPIAVYAPAVDKTFFVYGGARTEGERYLVSMAASYDHATGLLTKPVVVHDHGGVDDPHDNPSLMIAPDGRLWVFVAGRAKVRPGHVYRSITPYDTSAFDHVGAWEFTYPQPMHFGAKGFLLFHTIYEYSDKKIRNRNLFIARSADGVTWEKGRPLARLSGSYQVSGRSGDRIGTFFNRHPDGDVDRRTDLYYLQSDNLGDSWAAADGTPVATPLTQADNPARVRALSEEGKLMYGMDLNFDAEGRPVLLYLTSRGAQPGPQSGDREWWVSHWTGESWRHVKLTTSTHNYDTGCLLIGADGWRVVGPTAQGPQPWGTGGEIEEWLSQDQGLTWSLSRRLTRASTSNHSYARRVSNGRSPFDVLWADGNPDTLSPSHLYFFSAASGEVWRMPPKMTTPTALPEKP